MKQILGEKITAISGLRFIGFFAIMLEHSGLTIGAGEWAVSLFVLISGFCMSINHLYEDSIDKTSTVKLVTRKLRKIYPLHIIMILIAFPIALKNAHTIAESWNWFDWGGKFVLDSLMVSSWCPIYKFWSAINIPSWYLGIYLFSLVMIKPILKGIRRIRDSMRMCLGIIMGLFFLQAILFALWRVCDNSINLIWFTYRFPLLRLLDFVIGCLCGAVFIKIKDKISVKSWLVDILQIILFIVVIIMCKSYKPFFPSDSFFQCWIRTTWFVIPNALIIFLSCMKSSLINRILGNIIFVKLGSLVVFAFLVHHAVIDYCYIGINDPWMVMSISIEISLLAAWIYSLGCKKLAERKG